MDRLTGKYPNGGGHYLICSGWRDCPEHCEECEKFEEAIERLAYYEDLAEKMEFEDN